MKVKMNIVFCISVISIALLIQCDHAVGHRGVSASIQDSKDRGVFFSKLAPLSNPFNIGDSIILHFENGWIERVWLYGKDNESVVLDSSHYQLFIRTQKEDLIYYDEKWKIGIKPDLCFRTSGYTSLMCDITGIPPDTIRIPVQAGNSVSPNRSKKIIGEFVLLVE